MGLLQSIREHKLASQAHEALILLWEDLYSDSLFCPPPPLCCWSVPQLLAVRFRGSARLCACFVFWKTVILLQIVLCLCCYAFVAAFGRRCILLLLISDALTKFLPSPSCVHADTKAWEVDTLRGHVNNVSCVLFHARSVTLSPSTSLSAHQGWYAAAMTAQLVAFLSGSIIPCYVNTVAHYLCAQAGIDVVRLFQCKPRWHC